MRSGRYGPLPWEKRNAPMKTAIERAVILKEGDEGVLVRLPPGAGQPNAAIATPVRRPVSSEHASSWRRQPPTFDPFPYPYPLTGSHAGRRVHRPQAPHMRERLQRESLCTGTHRAARLSDAIRARVLPNAASASPWIRVGSRPSRFAKSLTRQDRWRRGPESNRPTRICNPVHNRFATAPSPRSPDAISGDIDLMKKGSRGFPVLLSGAGEESR